MTHRDAVSHDRRLRVVAHIVLGHVDDRPVLQSADSARSAGPKQVSLQPRGSSRSLRSGAGRGANRAWMLVNAPILMEFRSPRSTAPYQMEECSPRVTSPMTEAEGAMKPAFGSVGDLSKMLSTGRWRLSVSCGGVQACVKRCTCFAGTKNICWRPNNWRAFAGRAANGTALRGAGIAPGIRRSPSWRGPVDPGPATAEEGCY